MPTVDEIPDRLRRHLETWLGAWLRAGLLASPGPRSRAAALGMAMAAPAFLNGVWSVLAR